jgi:hypothetical protein
MADRVCPRNVRVIQKSQGGLSPRMQIQQMIDLGPEEVQRRRENRDIAAWYTRTLVMRERAEAESRGVTVMVNETRPDHYCWAEVYD